MGKRWAPKNTYWRGGILWGRATIASKEYRWSLRTRDGALAKSRVKAERERLIGAAHYGEQRHKYEDVFVEWSDHIATQVGAQTAKRYSVSLKQLEPELLPLFIDEISKATVNEIVKRRRGQGISTATIRRDLTALSSLLEYADDHDYREGNPALARLRKLKERRDPIVLPQHPHIARVIKRAGSSMLGSITKAAIATGCRQAELVYAERRHFDRARRQLTVIGKGNKLRTIDLDPATATMIARLPACIGCRYLFWQGEGEPLAWTYSRFRDLVAAELDAAQKAAQDQGVERPDFERFTFHHLRHRFAVDWLKSGKSIYDLKEHLGHTSVATTEIYLRFLTVEEQRAAKSAAAHRAAQDQRSGAGKHS